MATEPHVELPAPTAWPLIVAFGVTLTAAGLVTSAAVGMLGLLCAGVGGAGWVRYGVPHGRRAPERQRAGLPLEIYPVSAGIKGGFAGSLVMAVLAMIYGILSGT